MLVQCPRCGLIATVLPRGAKNYEACFNKQLCLEAQELAQENGQPQDPKWICEELRSAILDAIPSPPRRRKSISPPEITPTTP